MMVHKPNRDWDISELYKTRATRSCVGNRDKEGFPKFYYKMLPWEGKYNGLGVYLDGAEAKITRI